MKDSERLKFCQLLLKKIEGTLSSEEQAVMYQELEVNQELLEIYIDFAFLHSTLTKPGQTVLKDEQKIASDQLDQLLLELSQVERDAEPVVIDASPVVESKFVKNTRSIQPRHQTRKSSFLAVALSAAAILIVFLYVHFVPIRNDEYVGVLSHTVNPQWLDSSGRITDGCDLYAGPLHLVKGYAEIYTEKGSQIILQAPVELDLESDSQLFLRKGQVTIKVGDGEDHYIVRTPTASVVDFGTEFGVCVNNDHHTFTHVYEGQVELRSGSDPLRLDRVLKLFKGQGGQADALGRLSEAKRLSHLFVRSNEFEIKLAADNGSAYQRWLAYSYEVRRNPDLVLYYPFIKSDANRDFITNYAPNTKGELKGTLGGTFGISNFTHPAWTTGRWKEKAALQFDRNRRNCIAVAKHTALDLGGEITLAVWVCCPEPQKGGHLLSNRVQRGVNYQFGCFSDDDPYYAGQFQFLKTNESDSMVYSTKRYEWTSEWTFLAVTHDMHTVRFYVNGRLFESIPFATDWQPDSANLFIGDVPAIAGNTYGYAAFHGLIDEIALFKKALSTDEILAMYLAGKP